MLLNTIQIWERRVRYKLFSTFLIDNVHQIIEKNYNIKSTKIFNCKKYHYIQKKYPCIQKSEKSYSIKLPSNKWTKVWDN